MSATLLMEGVSTVVSTLLVPITVNASLVTTLALITDLA